ncbi:polysaccharide pyruvyl transferase family protein [Kaistella faecalis]|uniref:polysaccharide pyruvyl transferase family protein n=1 Tax=Kaistella faecalis TaxID=2852098 RepID=UPI001C467C43|nr:polysaccharide pyruvyl transferase family protein [Chryseobacterium faecale]UFK97096.1 polysaccharide pyruvyl transferase family protein [Chryseobacterium faecale]
MLQKILKIKSYLKYKYNVYRDRVKHLQKLRTLNLPIFIDGHPDSKNFGDGLNIFLGEYLSGKDVFPSKFIKDTEYKNDISYSVIGSVCQWSREKTVVWGSGFIKESYQDGSFVKPQKVAAVRGPLTRKIYLANGVECPEIYGDPALLMPLIYNPHLEIPRYEYGIIPHYTEADSDWVKKQRKNANVLFIDIMIESDYQKFISQIKSCKKIVTSSLHGLILSHAYQIPVSHISLSDKLTGGDFKFNDYLLSVNKAPKKPYQITANSIPIDSLEFDSEPLKINIRPLINACPFIKTQIKEKLLKQSVYYEGS